MQVRSSIPEEEVDRVFRALADKTRRDIVRRTLIGEVTVSTLASGYDMSFAAVQKHVAVLQGAGLVTNHAQGRERLVQGNPDTIQRAQALLDQFEALWRNRVARLDMYPGGRSEYAMTRPDGDVSRGDWELVSVVPGESCAVRDGSSTPTALARQSCPLCASCSASPPPVEGGTLLSLVITYPSVEVRDMVLATGMIDGMDASYARLETNVLPAA